MLMRRMFKSGAPGGELSRQHDPSAFLHLLRQVICDLRMIGFDVADQAIQKAV